MSDFAAIMREWKRMCDAMTKKKANDPCTNCPLDSKKCGAIWEVEDVNWEQWEALIDQWVQAHPEPKCPTWEEWLESKNIIGMNAIKLQEGADYVYNLVKTITPKAKEEIPADIAEKLGITPKEEKQ